MLYDWYVVPGVPCWVQSSSSYIQPMLYDWYVVPDVPCWGQSSSSYIAPMLYDWYVVPDVPCWPLGPVLFLLYTANVTQLVCGAGCSMLRPIFLLSHVLGCLCCDTQIYSFYRPSNDVFIENTNSLLFICVRSLCVHSGSINVLVILCFQ